jgi:hypothetical protein
MIGGLRGRRRCRGQRQKQARQSQKLEAHRHSPLVSCVRNLHRIAGKKKESETLSLFLNRRRLQPL